MAEIVIRQAIIEDIPEIQKLMRLDFAEAKKDFDPLYNINYSFEKDGVEYINKSITNPNHITLIATDENRIIGYIIASSKVNNQFINNLKIAELENMFILDKYRSQGYGSKLINEFFSWGKNIGAKRFIVYTFHNSKAVGFYKKNGFNDYGFELRYDL